MLPILLSAALFVGEPTDVSPPLSEANSKLAVRLYRMFREKHDVEPSLRLTRSHLKRRTKVEIPLEILRSVVEPAPVVETPPPSEPEKIERSRQVYWEALMTGERKRIRSDKYGHTLVRWTGHTGLPWSSRLMVATMIYEDGQVNEMFSLAVDWNSKNGRKPIGPVGAEVDATLIVDFKETPLPRAQTRRVDEVEHTWDRAIVTLPREPIERIFRESRPGSLSLRIGGFTVPIEPIHHREILALLDDVPLDPQEPTPEESSTSPLAGP